MLALAVFAAFLLVLLPCSHGSFLFGPNWNDLRVRSGWNPFTSNKRMPRTEDQATSWGFTKFSDCTSNPQLRGNRYMKDGDSAVILIYDTNGYIAGIQAGIPKDNPDINYPPSSLKPPFIDDGDQWVITAYFVDPSIICGEGRTVWDFQANGTGTDLYLQNGLDPESDYMIIPHEQSEVDPTGWVRGRCNNGVGRHYWYETKRDMSCEDMFPVFLIYNRGKLNGLGWAFQAELTSERYELKRTMAFRRYFRPVPYCLGDIPRVSMLHIFLTKFPRLNFC